MESVVYMQLIGGPTPMTNRIVPGATWPLPDAVLVEGQPRGKYVKIGESPLTDVRIAPPPYFVGGAWYAWEGELMDSVYVTCPHCPEDEHELEVRYRRVDDSVDGHRPTWAVEIDEILDDPDRPGCVAAFTPAEQNQAEQEATNRVALGWC